MSSTPEISPAVLNNALAVAAKACQRGQPTSQALDAAVHHLRAQQALSMLDEARVRGWLERELPEAIRRASKDASTTEEKNAAEIPDAARQLYRMTGPTQFTPVGKPPFIFPPLWLYRLIDGQTVRKLSASCRQRRKIIAAATAIAFLIAAAFPPWIQTYDLNTTHTQSDAGYAFITSPPQPRDYSYAIGIKLDQPRLDIEFAGVLAAGFGAWFLLGGEKKDDRKN